MKTPQVPPLPGMTPLGLKFAPVPQTTIARIQVACSDLREARNQLRRAGANKAADAVNRALKSADGALRHAQGKADR